MASTAQSPKPVAGRPLVQLCRFMSAQSLLLATAESCTAGLIAAHLADVPGAGSLLDCAFVVYSPEAKQRVLSVSEETLAHYNLTSEEVAREMAQGVLSYTQATVIIANTGVTDDTDPAIPAGTQCFAWLFRGRDGPDRLFSETRQFSGDRNQIREDAAVYALMQIPDLHARFMRG